MRNLIIERIKLLRKAKLEKKIIPANPNELELSKDIADLFKKELDALIDEGSITVAGVTINKHRIFKT